MNLIKIISRKINKVEKISVIVNFYNMRRESKRTLFSLSKGYQSRLPEESYEIIAIDNGSTQPIDENVIDSFGGNFRYVYFESKYPSPCAALNYGVSLAKYDNVMLCIDGARILSPSVLSYTLELFSLYRHPFVYTLGMHLGHKPQNYLLSEGYNQDEEDKLLETVDWKRNGYELFNISSLALSAKKGFFSCLAESNCFALRKKDYWDIGGFDERFISKGGGIANLDIFSRIISDDRFKRVMLLGEATFHQFHGGVATNVEMDDHPLKEMLAEYKQIHGQDYEFIFKLPHIYHGRYQEEYHEKIISVDKD